MSKSNALSLFVKSALLGSIGLFLFYFLLLTIITKDPRHPLNQFFALQPWMSILVVGFGIQVGMFRLLRRGYKWQIVNKQEANVAAGTGATVSGISMIACCVHHIADVVPILGISGASLFFSEYQRELLILGVVTNTAGVIYMLWILLGKTKPSTLLAYIFQRR